MSLAEVPAVSRYTYRYHLWHELPNNIFAGVFGLADFVARKGLSASKEEIVIFTTVMPAFSLLASFWAYLMEGRAKRPYIIAAALLGRGALLFTAIVTGSAWFIAICCLVALFDPIFLTAQQAILQANYESSWRGRLHGRIILWTRAALVASSLGAAYVLDLEPDYYRWLFPMASVIGILSFLQFASMRVRRRESPPRLPIGAWKRVRQILREHPHFDAFERNFYLYGTAFHMLVPVSVFLFADQDQLNLSYTHNSLSRILVFQVVIALLSPFTGHLLDRWRAPRTSAWAFTLLGIYPLLLFATWWFKSIELVYVSCAWFGLAMAGVNTAWNLGAMQFSGKEDASVFMGIHVSAVGVRGICAPVIGHTIAQYLGLGTTFLVASSLFFLAGFLMFRLDRAMKTLSR
jgi:MFS family permease